MFVSFILLYPIHGIPSGPVAILVAVPGQVSCHTLISYHDHLTWAARMDARVCKWWYARDHRLIRHSIPYIFVGSKPWAMQVDSVVYIYRFTMGCQWTAALPVYENTCHGTLDVKSYMLDISYLNSRYGVKGWHSLSETPRLCLVQGNGVVI